MNNLKHLLFKILFAFTLLTGISKQSFSQAATHLNFDGANDAISLSSTGFPLGNSARTIEAWIRTTQNNGGGAIMTYGNLSANNRFALYQTGGSLAFVAEGNDYNTGIAINNGAWHHVAATFDGTNLKVYLDGVQIGTNQAKTFNTTGTPFSIGYRGVANSENFQGDIDEVRVWNFALSASEILRTKNCELLGSETGLLAYYKFNQGTGGGNNAGVTTLTNSGSGGATNNGTLTNFALTGAISNWQAGSPVTTGSTIPAAPTASAQSFCSGNSPTVANLVPAPLANRQWYNVATGGTALATTTALATATYYVDTTNAAGCKSARTTVSVTVNTTPAAPIATAQSFCGSTTVASLVPAASATIKWYNVATGGMALASTTAITATGTYYAAAVNASGCESIRTSVTITINTIPAAPTVTAQSFCGSTTVASLVPAPSATINWYNVATGGTALASTTAITATGTYYAAEVNASGCESVRTPVAVTINSIPAAPTTTTTIYYVQGATATTLTATGFNLLWYTVATGGTGSATAPTPSTATVGTTSYWVSQTVSSCESPRTKIDVIVALPATHLNFDGNNDYVDLGNSLNTELDPINNFTLEAWVRSETNTGFGVIIGNYSNGGGQAQFFLRRQNDGYNFAIQVGAGFQQAYAAASVVTNIWQHLACVWNGSDMKIYVNGVLKNTATGVTMSSFPTTANSVVIGNNSINEIFKGGIDEIRIWSNAASADDIARRMNCEINGNESGLLRYYKFNQGLDGASNTTVASLIDATANANNGSLTNFALTGASSNWLSGSPVTTGSITPGAPEATAQIFCSAANPTVANLVPAPLSNRQWYNVATGGTPLSTITALATGTYYVDTTNAAGCKSARTAVSVTVNANPTAPTASAQSFCSTTSPTVANLIPAPLSNRQWYNVATGGTALATTTALATGTYYVDTTNAVGCASASTSVSITINTVAAPTATAQSFCGSTTVASLVPAPSATINWYNVATGGATLASTTAITATGTYYAAAVNASGCESVRTSVAVTINTLPVVNAISNQTLCNVTATTAVNFTGTATSYNWTNDNTTIGLAASGTGNIPAFTATNTGGTAVTATITATPINSQTMAYIANLGSNSVSVVNTATNTVIATVAVGSQPFGVSVSPDGSKVYVAISDAWSSDVSVINTGSNTVIATVAVGSVPQGVAVSTDGSKVYVANGNSNTVSVINTTTNAVDATIFVGTTPWGVSVSPNGSKVYVANSNSTNVSVINTATNTVSATVTVGSQPRCVSVSPDGSKVYVSNYNSNYISVINTATNTVSATVGVGFQPYGVSVSPDGSKVYVANYSSNSVSVINSATNTVTATVMVGTGPVGVSVSPDGSKVYVANNNSNNVSVINTATNTVIATVAVGILPVSLGNFITNVPGCTGTTQSFTITVNPSTDATIAMANTTQTIPVSGITYFSNGCTDNLIAKINPTGASPVSGSTTAKVWIESTQPAQFVKRHYEITPATNTATATAKVTLYFTQPEFDAFNAVSAVDLPTGPADATGKANLLIEKRSGVSSDGSGLPSTYTGSIITIDPLDADIVWNVTASRWEISFDVTGFSGFFVKTAASVLPLRIINFTGTKQANANALNWLTADEINTNQFELERSTDGRSYNTIALIKANGNGSNNYSYTDNTATAMCWYRLKIMDTDGRFTYSNIVKLNSLHSNNISVYPNPVQELFTIQGIDRSMLKTTVQLVDATGKLIKNIVITATVQQVNIDNLNKGIYFLRFNNGSVIKVIKE